MYLFPIEELNFTQKQFEIIWNNDLG
jgi:hypothetical protein